MVLDLLAIHLIEIDVLKIKDIFPEVSEHFFNVCFHIVVALASEFSDLAAGHSDSVMMICYIYNS
ncbi:hypothetical protein OIPHN260_12870 [Enterobacter roggenkampii]|uniref:Uncharacterized protein n=1 Tax=Enterobacter roggenkampii TaxID=1812935 RepID=A0AAU9BU34_9ENTR|nr:hypothetical protein OIPHN260_12870 [Enterobacter roggenkampii]